MDIGNLLGQAVSDGASDVFIVPGLPLSRKIDGLIAPCGDAAALTPALTRELIAQIYAMSTHKLELLDAAGDDDFSFAITGVSRFRVNTYKQRGTLAAVIRIVNFDLPDPKEIGLPDAVLGLANQSKGLVLVTGPAGSGKSTTLACVLDRINQTRNCHIITLEDPIEYLHHHGQSIVSQREIPTDSADYVTALRASLRQSPDVILLGEMRDHETISTAMTAAETGHLVLSTLHTIGAANTIDRVIDAFRPEQQPQIRAQLSMVLNAVVSQQLLPTVKGGVVPAFEIMFVNSAIRNMIRENKIHQIDTVIFSSSDINMVGMDASLLRLCKEGVISDKTALMHCQNPDTLSKKLGVR